MEYPLFDKAIETSTDETDKSIKTVSMWSEKVLEHFLTSQTSSAKFPLSYYALHLNCTLCIKIAQLRGSRPLISTTNARKVGY